MGACTLLLLSDTHTALRPLFPIHHLYPCLQEWQTVECVLIDAYTACIPDVNGKSLSQESTLGCCMSDRIE